MLKLAYTWATALEHMHLSSSTWAGSLEHVHLISHCPRQTDWFNYEIRYNVIICYVITSDLAIFWIVKCVKCLWAYKVGGQVWKNTHVNYWATHSYRVNLQGSQTSLVMRMWGSCIHTDRSPTPANIIWWGFLKYLNDRPQTPVYQPWQNPPSPALPSQILN